MSAAHEHAAPPRQAVILAGGRGTRMQPLTDTLPKPMIPFHGKPFMGHVVDMLREQGFERVLMLLGYKADVIQEHFGDGSAYGVEVDYNVTGADDLTASRVRLVDDRLDPTFLLLYCDNYWPLQMDRHWAAYEAGGRPCLVTVYTNKDGYTKNSVKVEGDRLAVFDKSRKTPDLQGVEISYALLDRDTVLDLLPTRAQLPEHDELFEVAVYPELARRGDLSALVTDHRYYSVGSLERLPLTERFFARTPTVILDRDGVLNRKPPRAEYVRSPAEWEWLPGALQALALLQGAGYRVVIVSNQAGVARGAMTEADLHGVHDAMKADVARAGGRIDALYYCPHGWDEGCECRKPRPGMLFQAQRDLDLDLSRTLFIGDDDRDGQAADAAGCRFAQVTETTSLLDLVTPLVRESGRPTLTTAGDQ